MYRSIETLTKNNSKVFSIKTDALTIKHDDLDLLDFEPGLGKWRHSKTGKDIIFPTNPLEKRVPNLTQLPQKAIITHPLSIQEEYNTEYICKDIIEKHNIIVIRAKYADSGKSYICLLYTSPSPRDLSTSRMPSSA